MATQESSLNAQPDKNGSTPPLSLPAAVEIIIGDMTWMLPDTNMEIPQPNGTVIIMGPTETKAEGQILTVPPEITAPITSSAGGLSVTFQPAVSTSTTGDQLGTLRELQPRAAAISLMLHMIHSAGSSWAAEVLSDADFFSVLGSTLDALVSTLRILSTPSQAFADTIMSLEKESVRRIIDALTEARIYFNLTSALQSLLAAGLDEQRQRIQQFWNSDASILLRPPIAISQFSNTNYSIQIPEINPDAYLLTTYSGTPLMTFNFLVDALDGKKGVQIVSEHIPWQEYLCHVSDIYAEALGLLPFVETVEVDSDLDDGGF